MEGFLTQPVHHGCILFNLKEQEKSCILYILGGVLPIVSHRNAVYMNNEISGIEVDEEIVAMYEGTTRKEAQKLAVDIGAVKPWMKCALYRWLLSDHTFNRVEIIADMGLRISTSSNPLYGSRTGDTNF